MNEDLFLDVVIKEIYIQASFDILIAVILGIFAHRLYKKYKKSDYISDEILTLIIAGSIFSVVIGFIALVTGISMLLNPEYYAIQRLLEMISG